MNKEIILVSKDIQTQMAITKSLVCQADDLAYEHEQFNANYIVAGRIALYELLAKIYALSIELEDSPDKSEQVLALKKCLVEKYGIRTQENTSDLAVLIRYITKADRKTTHVYARAIEAAKLNQIEIDGFVNFIGESGGIEKLRSFSAADQSENDMPSIEERQQVALDFWRARGELPYAKFQMKNEIMSNIDVTEFEYFVCARRSGIRYIVGQIPADRAFEQRAIGLFGNYLTRDWNLVLKHLPSIKEKAKEKFLKRIEMETPTVFANMKDREEKCRLNTPQDKCET